MQVKLLHNLVEELAGEGTGFIAEILFNKKDVNEFLIAKKMELTINQVRNILYKLSNFGLVSFIRKKDDKKGWYIYYWTLNSEKCLVLIESSLEKKISDLEQHLQSRESDRYYVCRSCDIEVKEEHALESGFTCDECADVYELQDNTAHIKDIKIKTAKISKELELIKSELEEHRAKEEKKRKREEKKLQKEADERKELMRQARAAARKKLAKKAPAKKKVAKKTTKKKAAKKTTKKATKKTTKKAVKKVAKKAAKKTTKKKVAKKATKKVSKKIKKKAVKKTAKKTVKKATKKAAKKKKK